MDFILWLIKEDYEEMLFDVWKSKDTGKPFDKWKKEQSKGTVDVRKLKQNKVDPEKERETVEQTLDILTQAFKGGGTNV